jgi:hypothetical protein
MPAGSGAVTASPPEARQRSQAEIHHMHMDRQICTTKLV